MISSMQSIVSAATPAENSSCFSSNWTGSAETGLLESDEDLKG